MEIQNCETQQCNYWHHIDQNSADFAWRTHLFRIPLRLRMMAVPHTGGRCASHWSRPWMKDSNKVVFLCNALLENMLVLSNWFPILNTFFSRPSGSQSKSRGRIDPDHREQFFLAGAMRFAEWRFCLISVLRTLRCVLLQSCSSNYLVWEPDIENGFVAFLSATTEGIAWWIAIFLFVWLPLYFSISQIRDLAVMKFNF